MQSISFFFILNVSKYIGVDDAVTNNILKFYCKNNGVLYENGLIQVYILINSIDFF